MAWKGEKLNFISLSDIHLGHDRTPTHEIIERLKIAIPDNEETGELDIIFLAGDIFDKLLFYPDGPTHDVSLWISALLRICAKRNILIRVLEGTPSHDRGQGRHFITINELADIGADVRYVDILSVEYIEKLDISVLYIPDEWDVSPDSTWEQAQKAVFEAGLKQVDFAIMHGMFEYQLPPHLNFTHHLSERYLKLVRGYVLIGHVHLKSKVERILVAGSFDRISHNEEGPKGHWSVKCSKNYDDDEIIFIENKQATPYVTLSLAGMSVEAGHEAVQALMKDVLKSTDDSKRMAHIRLEWTRGSDVAALFDHYRGLYPFYGWKSKVVDDETMSIENVSDLGRKYETVEIHKANIVPLIEEELLKSDAPQTVKERAAELLNDYL